MHVSHSFDDAERASPALLLRWKEEQAGQVEHVCATDWLVQICLLPHDVQDAELAHRIATIAAPATSP